MIKAIIFDLDYTLFDTDKYARGAYEDCVKYFSNKNKIEEALLIDYLDQVIDEFGIMHDYFFNNWLSRFNAMNDQNLQTCVSIFRKHHPSQLNLYPGVNNLLKNLRKKEYHLGIITDGNQITQRRKVSLLKLNNLVDHITITDEYNTSKPDESVFEVTCKKLKVSPSESLFVGDNPFNDIFGAKSVKMKTARVLQGKYAKEKDYKNYSPDMRLDTILDLLKYV